MFWRGWYLIGFSKDELFCFLGINLLYGSIYNVHISSKVTFGRLFPMTLTSVACVTMCVVYLITSVFSYPNHPLHVRVTSCPNSYVIFTFPVMFKCCMHDSLHCICDDTCLTHPNHPIHVIITSYPRSLLVNTCS